MGAKLFNSLFSFFIKKATVCAHCQIINWQWLLHKHVFSIYFFATAIFFVGNVDIFHGRYFTHQRVIHGIEYLLKYITYFRGELFHGEMAEDQMLSDE